MEEIYYSHRRKRKSKLYRLVMWYMIFVMLRMLVLSYGVRIVRINQDERGLFSDYPKGQKVLVLSSAYGIRLFSKRNFRQWQPMKKGDIVLIEQSVGTFTSKKKKILYKILNAFTMGIIRVNNTLVFRTVVATTGDTIYYSLSHLSHTMPEQIHDDTSTGIPYFDDEKTMTIPPKEVFLVGKKPYEIDSRISGTHKYTDVLGKAIMLLGPKWGRVPSKQYTLSNTND